VFYKFLRALAGLESGRHCRVCRDAISPGDLFGLGEGVCEPCRE
jgi:predicted nucleic acid-binding Zn ribbon protein